MIVAILIILALIAAIGFFAWQYQIEQTAALAAQIRIAEIQAQGRIDYLDHMWPFAVLLAIVGTIAILSLAYVIIATKRPRPIVNDHRTIYLMLPDGQTRRQYFKSLGTYNALPLAPPRPQKIEHRAVKMLGRGER